MNSTFDRIRNSKSPIEKNKLNLIDISSMLQMVSKYFLKTLNQHESVYVPTTYLELNVFL